VFCSIIVAGFAVGGLVAESFQCLEDPPVWLAAAAAGVIGWASGAALVWLIRICGTLCFGKEAMGLGDVHLMGAAGALLGWFAPLLAFALAPFVALCWLTGLALVEKCRGRWSGEFPPMPFGPHLAIATMAVVLGHRPIQAAWQAWFGQVLPWPQ
jgi:leader peptidase (prepilin peptidase)/N-methyltransferase